MYVAPGDISSTRAARLRLEVTEELAIDLDEVTCDELVYCRYVTPHEGQRPSYGAIVVPAGGSVTQHGRLAPPTAAAFVDSEAPLDVLRTFSDGRTSFVVRIPGSRPALVVDPGLVGDELTLAAYARTSGATIVQRLMSGRIRLFTNDRVYSEEGSVWLEKPTAFAYYEQLMGTVDSGHDETARSILDLCVHTLSPAGHGATLIWFPDGAAPTEELIETEGAIDAPRVSAAVESHRSAIAGALGQVDRAVLLGEHGELRLLNVTLGHSEPFASRLFEGGTRHTSAGRYSASEKRAVVFVVSADGPVTVFHQGAVVASINASQ